MNGSSTNLFECGQKTTPIRIAVTGPADSSPQHHELNYPFAVIGRSSMCDITLPDADVSYRHAYLQMIGSQIFCVDLSSRTGIRWEHGVKKSDWLTTGRRVHIGPYTIERVGQGGDGTDDSGEFPLHFNPLAVYGDELGPLPQIKLEFLNGVTHQPVWSLTRMLTLVGRTRRCKIHFEHDSVSGVHCGLLLTRDGLWTVDLLGHGGTQVDGRPVRCARLDSGQLLQVGEFCMSVQCDYTKNMETAVLNDNSRCPTRLSSDSVITEPGSDHKQDVPRQETTCETIDDDAADSSIPLLSFERTMSVASFIERATSTGLLRQIRIDEILANWGETEPSLEEFALILIRQGLLSEWQVKQLATGKNRKLVLDNRYKLVNRLASGGMGHIYRGFDTRLGRDVTLKVPRTRMLRNPRNLKRFRREANISGRLNHPNIVRTLDYGDDGNFIVFEYVEGENIRKLVRRVGCVDPAVAVDYVAQVAEALKAAHDTQGDCATLGNLA